ncbi:MAG: proline--tRNA ligase [candidate division NC10 bacterium]|nr:proline--tRNA ligase [candidate division NC10 bacterium]
MRWTRSLIPTLKEDPAEAEAVSHRLMVRAGLVRQLAAGIYVYLPLGQRVLDKVNAVIREEMNRIGGQEITMPVLHPAELWQQTGRWSAIGDEMFRLKDRGKREMCLGMTHEEVIGWLAAREVRSYRDLPQTWYQIQVKLRDEARPKSGVLRTREFLMKDSYTLDRDEAGLEKSYQLHKEAYCRIFERCGLAFHVVESDPGIMGGAGAHEFMAPSEAGEDEVALCDRCDYSANVELASSRPRPPEFPDWNLEEIPTPNAGTIEQVCALLRIDPALTIKSLLLVTKEGPLLALVRGDQQLHEKKLAMLVGEVRPAHRDEILMHLGAEAGSIGPVGTTLPTIADESLRTGRYVVGANKDGFHVRGVVPGTHFQPRWADIHHARSGDGCPRCDADLRIERVIEVGNIFKLGTKYSVSLKAMYLNEAGEERPIVMGSYGIGPARIAAAAIEQHHDQQGIIWPEAIAPYQLHLLPVNMRDEKMMELAEALYAQLQAERVEVLYDDRAERPGVKFKDADLLGLPLRVTIGSHALKEGVVELKVRRTGEEFRVPPSEVVSKAKSLLSNLLK